MRNLGSIFGVLAVGLWLAGCPDEGIVKRPPDLSELDAGPVSEADAGAAAEADASVECEGDIVDSSGRCLQDDAFCYELPDGRWCTGPQAPMCPADSHPVAFDAPCQEGHRCWEYSPSLRCESDAPSTDGMDCDSCEPEPR